MDAKTRQQKFLRVLIGCITFNLSASQYVWSVFSKYYITEAGWSATTATLPYSINVFISGFGVLIAGPLGDRIPPRFVALIGTALCTAGWFICGMSTEAWLITIAFGLMCGLSCSFLPNATTPTAVKWAPADKKGIAAGISHACNGFSSVYMAPLANALMVLGAAAAFKSFSAICLCLGLLGSINLLTPTPEIIADGQKAVVKDGKKQAEAFILPEVSIKQAVKTKTFWLMWLMTVCALIGGTMVFSQCAMIAKVQGNWDAGFVLVAILAIANGCGRLLFSHLMDRLGTYKTYTIMWSLAAVNMAMFPIYNNIPLLIVGVCISGATYGGTNVVLYTAASREFGSRYLGSIIGGLNTGFGINGLIGPTIIAMLYDLRGDYIPAYYIGAVLMAAAVIMVQMLKKEHNNRIAEVLKTKTA